MLERAARCLRSGLDKYQFTADELGYDRIHDVCDFIRHFVQCGNFIRMVLVGLV